MGLLIGIIFGSLQFLLFSKLAGRGGGKKSVLKTLLVAFSQFLLPFTALILGTIVFGGELWLVAVGIFASLISCAGIKFVINARAAHRQAAKKTAKKPPKK